MAYNPISLSRTAGTIASLSPMLWIDVDYSFSYQSAMGRTAGFLQDLSGNKNGFRQLVPSKKPLIVPSGKNSRPVLRFDGTDDWMQCVNAPETFKFLNSGASTIFVVHKPWTVADPNAVGFLLDNVTLASSIGSRTGFYLRPDDRAASSINDNVIVVVTNQTGGGGINVIGTTASNGVAPANTWSINVFKIDPANATPANRLYASRNGGTEYQGNSSSGGIGTGGPIYPMALGANGGDGLSPYTGDLAALVIFQGVLSAGNISAVLTELNSRWGVY